MTDLTSFCLISSPASSFSLSWSSVSAIYLVVLFLFNFQGYFYQHHYYYLRSMNLLGSFVLWYLVYWEILYVKVLLVLWNLDSLIYLLSRNHHHPEKITVTIHVYWLYCNFSYWDWQHFDLVIVISSEVVYGYLYQHYDFQAFSKIVFNDAFDADYHRNLHEEVFLKDFGNF